MSLQEIFDFFCETSPRLLFIYSIFLMLVSGLLSWKASAPQNLHDHLAPLGADLFALASTGFKWTALVFAVMALLKIFFKLASD